MKKVKKKCILQFSSFWQNGKKKFELSEIKKKNKKQKSQMLLLKELIINMYKKGM